MIHVLSHLEQEDDWLTEGHEWIGARVARGFEQRIVCGKVCAASRMRQASSVQEGRVRDDIPCTLVLHHVVLLTTL